MKNACIVYKNQNSGFTQSNVDWVADAFLLGGYALDEIRCICNGDEKRLSAALADMKAQTENVILLADLSQFVFVKSIVLSVYAEEKFVSENGTSVFADKQKTLFLLPADKQSVSAVKELCIPFLQRKYGKRTDTIVIRSVGANALRVDSLIAEAKRIDNGILQYAHTRRFDEDVLSIVYDERASKLLLDDVVRIFVDGLGDTVYALNDISLAEQLVELLKLRKKKISVAESFTGGGIARRLVSVPGVSEVYFEGLNTYNERSKMKRLGVSEYTLHTFGAVSDQTAYEMAAGLIESGDADIAIATTGLAGPNTDRSMLPVGLCFIAVGVKERIFVYRYKFDGTREEITEKAIQYALFLAYKQLKKM